MVDEGFPFLVRFGLLDSVASCVLILPGNMVVVEVIDLFLEDIGFPDIHNKIKLPP